MNLKEIRDAYESLSGKLSDINRQLAFAGIGIIWIFKVSGATGDSAKIPDTLLYPLSLLCLSLLLDVMQYLYLTILWYGVYCKNKKRGCPDEKIKVNDKESWNFPAWIFFVLKVVLLIFAYFLLLKYLFYNLF